MCTAKIVPMPMTNIQNNRINSPKDARNKGFNSCSHRDIVNCTTQTHGFDARFFYLLLNLVAMVSLVSFVQIASLDFALFII